MINFADVEASFGRALTGGEHIALALINDADEADTAVEDFAKTPAGAETIAAGEALATSRGIPVAAIEKEADNAIAAANKLKADIVAAQGGPTGAAGPAAGTGATGGAAPAQAAGTTGPVS
jgi:hypothetical protein